MRQRSVPFVLFAAAVAAAPAAAQQSAVDALIRAERAFARDAQERTVTEAFLAALAADATLFRPGPVAGPDWLRENPSPPDLLLEWEPEFAAVSAAGDLGYTTGPWSAGRRGTEARGGFGRFVSVWAMRDGRWQVLIDHGIAHAGPRPAVADVARGPATTAGTGGLPDDADAALAAALAPGTEAAWAGALTADARVLRDGHLPATGAAAAALAAAGPRIAAWQRRGGGTARSRDLAWSWGEWQGADGARGVYLRTWRPVDGRWRIALDLATPLPAGS